MIGTPEERFQARRSGIQMKLGRQRYPNVKKPSKEHLVDILRRMIVQSPGDSITIRVVTALDICEALETPTPETAP